MRVVHLPVYIDNPYQDLLIRELLEQEVDVIIGGSGGRFLRTALFKWKADIYHFHWIHPYILHSRKWRAAIRGLLFVLEVLVLKLSGAKIVWTVHNISSHDG